MTLHRRLPVRVPGVPAICCEHCGGALTTVEAEKMKLRVKCVAFRLDGTAEAPCPHYHQSTMLEGLRLEVPNA